MPRGSSRRITPLATLRAGWQSLPEAPSKQPHQRTNDDAEYGGPWLREGCHPEPDIDEFPRRMARGLQGEKLRVMDSKGGVHLCEGLPPERDVLLEEIERSFAVSDSLHSSRQVPSIIRCSLLDSARSAVAARGFRMSRSGGNEPSGQRPCRSRAGTCG